MKLRRPLLLVAALALPALAVAENLPRPKMDLVLKPYQLDYRDFAFPSGFRVLFQRDDAQPVVSLSMVVDNGSTSDPPGKEGIAHLVEHMWFRSVHPDAQGKPLPKVWDLLRDLGATLNAYTAADLTNYMTVAPKDKLIPLLRLESLRMRAPVRGVTEDVLLVEREVVRNELRLNYENGGGDSWQYLYNKLFPPGYEYADLGIGTHDSLNAISLADVVKFTEENYGPQYTTLLVVGDIDLNKTSEYLSEFGIDQLQDPKTPNAELALVEPKARVTPVAGEPPPPYQPVLVKGETVGVTVSHASVEKPSVIVAWTLPGGYRESDAVAQLAVNTLNQAVYTGLFGGQLETGKEPEGFGCWYDTNVNVSLAACYVELAKGSEGTDIPEKVLDSLSYMWTTDETIRPFQDYAFSYARVAYMASIFSSVDLYASLFTQRVSQLANFVHYTGRADYFSQSFSAIAKVGKDDVRKFAEKYLNRNRAAAVVLQPLEEGDINVETTDAAYRGSVRGDSVESMLTEAQLTPQVIADSYVPPDLSKLMDEKLPNGARLLVMPHTNAPLVQVAASFRGGTKSTPLGEFAQDAWYINQGGVGWAVKPRPTDPLQIAGFDYVGVGAFNTQAGISASAGNIDGAMYILREDLNNFTANTSGSIDWAKARKKDVIATMGTPDGWASMQQMAHLFPNHPISDWLDHAEIDAIRTTPVAKVAEFYSQVFQPSNMTLYVVGNVTREEAKAAAMTYFGGWTGKGKPPTGAAPLATAYPTPALPAGRKVVIFDKKIASQSSVTYMCQTVPLTQDNFAAANVLADTMSEALWLALREQTGASYGAYAGVTDLSGGLGALFQGVSVQNDQAGLAVKTFIELAEKAARGGLDGKTLAISKFGRASGYVAGQQSTEQMLGRLMGILDRGWTLDFFRNYGRQISVVSNASTAPILKPCINNEYVAVVGPKDVLTGVFDKLGIKHEVFDWEQAKKDYAVAHNLKSAKDAAKDAAKEEKKK